MSVALHIVGFPSLYGGAGAELYHQVRVWEALGLRLHFIPTQKNVRKAALYGEMTERGHVIHDACDWAGIPEDAPVISFCNEDFLAALPEIRRRTRRTVPVNCMTCLFGKEKEAMSRGDIALFLYQNDKVRQSVMPHLRVLHGNPLHGRQACRLVRSRAHLPAGRRQVQQGHVAHLRTLCLSRAQTRNFPRCSWIFTKIRDRRSSEKQV